MTKYVSLDLETTGLNPQKCGIIQVGAVVFDRTDAIRSFCEYCWDDGKVFERGALEMHRKTHVLDNALQSTQSVQSVLDKLVATTLEPNLIYVGKNLKFDLAFLAQYNFPLPRDYIDVGGLNAALNYGQPICSLSKLIDKYKISVGGPHDALNDALAVVRILQRVWKDYL